MMTIFITSTPSGFSNEYRTKCVNGLYNKTREISNDPLQGVLSGEFQGAFFMSWPFGEMTKASILTRILDENFKAGKI